MKLRLVCCCGGSPDRAWPWEGTWLCRTKWRRALDLWAKGEPPRRRREQLAGDKLVRAWRRRHASVFPGAMT